MADKMNYAKAVRAAKNGNADAFQDLYDSTVNDVTAICRMLLNSSSDPDSVIVDTYLTIYESLGTLKNPKNFPAYARKAAATQCYNANQLRPAAPQDLGAPHNALDVVEDALNELKNDQRTTLLLQASGMSNADIADALGVTEYTVNSDIYFGKKKLMKSVNAHFDEVDFSQFGVGAEIPDNLLTAYTQAIFENVPSKVRSSQFNEVMNIFEGHATTKKAADEPLSPPDRAASDREAQDTVADEPQGNFFSRNPEKKRSSADMEATQPLSVNDTPYVDNEPTRVVPPVNPSMYGDNTPKQQPAFRQPQPKQQPTNGTKTHSASRRSASGSSSGNKRTALLITLIVLVVALIVVLIVVFAGHGGSNEDTTVPTSSFVVSTESAPSTQNPFTAPQTRAATQAETQTEPQTQEQTTAATTAAQTHHATTEAPVAPSPAAEGE